MPIVIKELVIKSPPPDPQAAPSGGEFPIESFSWSLNQADSHSSQFDGRLLTSQVLADGQDRVSHALPGADLLGEAAGAAAGGAHDRWIDLEPVGPITRKAGGGAGTTQSVGGGDVQDWWLTHAAGGVSVAAADPNGDWLF